MAAAVGGNGGNAAANAIQQECEVQRVECSVVGVPNSIGNAILLVRCRAQNLPGSGFGQCHAMSTLSGTGGLRLLPTQALQARCHRKHHASPQVSQVSPMRQGAMQGGQTDGLD